jgi:hypothetical protein
MPKQGKNVHINKCLKTLICELQTPAADQHYVWAGTAGDILAGLHVLPHLLIGRHC